MEFKESQAVMEKAYADFLKSVELKGYKLAMNPQNPGVLSAQNMRLITAYVLHHHTNNQGIAEITCQILWNWLKADQYAAEWEVAPAGVAAKQGNAVKKPASNLPIYGSLSALSDIQIKESEERANTIWQRCMQETFATHGNTKGRTIVRRQEISNLINTFRGRTDENSARECYAAIQQLKSTWSD